MDLWGRFSFPILNFCLVPWLIRPEGRQRPAECGELSGDDLKQLRESLKWSSLKTWRSDWRRKRAARRQIREDWRRLAKSGGGLPASGLLLLPTPAVLNRPAVKDQVSPERTRRNDRRQRSDARFFRHNLAGPARENGYSRWIPEFGNTIWAVSIWPILSYANGSCEILTDFQTSPASSQAVTIRYCNNE